MPTAYTLEVSSPGLDRPLRGLDDYRAVHRTAREDRDAREGRRPGVLQGQARRRRGPRRADRRATTDGRTGVPHRRDHRARIWKWNSKIMSNPLQQTIEALAKEKGIEPDVVISAIEEAVATASRKYYKTGENLKTRFNTGDRPGRSVRAQDGRRGGDDAGDRNCDRRSARDVPAALRRRRRQQHRARRRDGVPRSRPKCSAASPRRPPSR